ncbi:MAG TPA: hypothetical protein VII08_25155 [Myxococcales bacterium]
MPLRSNLQTPSDNTCGAHLSEPDISKGQTAVTTSDGTTGIYQNGTFTPLPAPPPGYQVGATGINDAGVIVGPASTNADPNHEQGYILVGSS